MGEQPPDIRSPSSLDDNQPGDLQNDDPWLRRMVLSLGKLYETRYILPS